MSVLVTSADDVLNAGDVAYTTTASADLVFCH